MSEENLKEENARLKAENRILKKGLSYYANPEQYFAIGIFPDPPCGNFINDFSLCWDTYIGQVKRPGKVARAVLEKIHKNNISRTTPAPKEILKPLRYIILLFESTRNAPYKVHKELLCQAKVELTKLDELLKDIEDARHEDYEYCQKLLDESEVKEELLHDLGQALIKLKETGFLKCMFEPECYSCARCVVMKVVNKFESYKRLKLI